MKTPGWQRNAMRLLLCWLLAAAGLPAMATGDFANVVTAAGFSTFEPPPTACNSSFQRGLGFESSGPLSCNVGAAAVTVFASASAPSGTMPGQLAELRASAQIDLPSGGPPRPYGEVIATAFADFRDYIDLGSARPDHMTLDFDLSGNLFLGGPYWLTQSALVDMSIEAQSGIGPPVYASALPFGSGEADAISTLVNDQSIQSGITYRAGSSPDFQFVSTAPGQYELTLGSSFFDNLYNTQVMLEFGLLSQVLVREDEWGPSEFSVTSDYSHTLRMTDVHAFDADGHDVTSDAFLGFESAGLAGVPAVPEPSEWLLMLAGLVWMATKASRSRQHRSAS